MSLWRARGNISHVAEVEGVGRQQDLERDKFSYIGCSQIVESLEC